MSKTGARSIELGSGNGSDSVATDGTKLSLRGLLRYLWDQAELTHWHPRFAGKRSWATVRKHLLIAAESKIARGAALQSRLYIPEIFTVEHRDEINARRVSHLMHAAGKPKGPRSLMLLIGEVKEIVPARYGFKAVIKHVPDQPSALDEQLYRRMGRRFERELSLWGASDAVYMMLNATFGLNAQRDRGAGDRGTVADAGNRAVAAHRRLIRAATGGAVGAGQARVREGAALQPATGADAGQRHPDRCWRITSRALHRAARRRR